MLDVYIDGLAAPIGATANHPFWSEDKHQFVRADELQSGELLKIATADFTTVNTVIPQPGTQDVFKIEVQVKHTYHVANDGVLVHKGFFGFEIIEGTRRAKAAQLYGHTHG